MKNIVISLLLLVLVSILSLIFGLFVTWLICLNSNLSDACGDISLFIVPIFIIIGLFLKGKLQKIFF